MVVNSSFSLRSGYDLLNSDATVHEGTEHMYLQFESAEFVSSPGSSADGDFYREKVSG